VIEAIRPQLRRYGLNEKILKAQAATARIRGAAVDEGNAAVDVTAIGRVVSDRGGVPIGAVFVASIRSRMVESRLQDLDKRLVTCVNAIQIQMRK
jgi:DNA-binding IclR family transcriptional regulator